MKRILRAIGLGLYCTVGLYLCWQLWQLFVTRPLAAIGVIIAIGAVSFIVRNEDQLERQRALKHMEGRPSLTPAEFGHRHFSSAQSGMGAEVRAIFAKHISVDVSQAHPDDLLVEDLRMDSLDSMSTVEFVLELEEHFHVSIPNSAAERMRTLRDVTDFIAHELQARQCT